jgi:hypothetical protein
MLKDLAAPDLADVLKWPRRASEPASADRLGSPVVTATFGGQQLGTLAAITAKVYEALAAQQSYKATSSSVLGQWDRRSSEWAFQLAQATQEVVQINDQITAASLRVQIVQADQANLTQQIHNAQAVQNFLQNWNWRISGLICANTRSPKRSRWCCSTRGR